MAGQRLRLDLVIGPLHTALPVRDEAETVSLRPDISIVVQQTKGRSGVDLRIGRKDNRAKPPSVDFLRLAVSRGQCI